MNGKTNQASCNTWNASKFTSTLIPTSSFITQGWARQTCLTNAVFPKFTRHSAKKCMFAVFLAIAVYLFSAVTAQSAVIYKWVDEKGNIHFDDHPPAQDAEKIIIENAPRRDNEYHEQLDKQTKLLKIYQEEKQEKEQEMEKNNKEKELRQDNCKTAKQNLNSIKTASFLYQATDDPRNPRILTKEERTSATARAEADVKHWCD